MTAKSGFAVLAGPPNCGKSSLLNRLAGGKLSIISPKPQTTRQNVRAIVQGKNCQAVFVDTPGFLEPCYALQKQMLKNLESGLREDADIIILVAEPRVPLEKEKQLCAILEKIGVPKFLVINKTDIAVSAVIKSVVDAYRRILNFDSVFEVSAKTGAGVAALKEAAMSAMPASPFLYPDGDWTDRAEKFYTGEFIREQIFNLYDKEIPYSCAVEIAEFRENAGEKDYIRAVIFVERDSQKGIIIGAKGAMIKKLRESAQREIEGFLGRDTYLELTVKVRPLWRSRSQDIEHFGYKQ